ncbi:MAG: type I-E CRISPR-associated endonuclease Cas1e [Candidatus Kapaibacterium sp.]
MPTLNYRQLPKVRDSLSHVYLEYGKLEQTKTGVEFINKKGSYQIPVANLSVIMLGPGTTITHNAVQSIVSNGCLLIWNGQEGVRYYAHSTGETHKSYKLQKQAELVSNPDTRKEVALRMFQYRFKEKLDKCISYENILGMEGLRVQDEYAIIAKKYGVKWKGRRYDRSNWDDADDLNKALSTASSCLNGICHSAIIAAGYSPGLGFIHQGKQLSFVYDIADLYRTRIIVPLAFATAAEYPEKLESTIRKRCRQAFRNLRLLGKIVPNIEKMLTIDDEIPDAFDPDNDPTMPTQWWLPPEEEDEE